VHSRRSPRAFPLGLLAPRCLGIRTAQIPGIEPFGFFLGRGSFLSPGRALRLLAESALAIPSPRFHSCVWCVAFAFDFWTSFFYGAHPLVMDALAEMPDGGKYMCLTRPPVRAQNRREEKKDGLLPAKLNSGIRNCVPSFSNLFYSIFFFKSI